MSRKHVRNSWLKGSVSNFDVFRLLNEVLEIDTLERSAWSSGVSLFDGASGQAGTPRRGTRDVGTA